MLDYEYSSVLIERVRDADTDEPWVYASLQLEPHDEKITLTYRAFGVEKLIISFEFYIEDWRDAFEPIVDERIHVNRRATSSETICPKDLRITGKRNPLVNMIILAFCSPDSAQLCLKLIDCSQDQLESLLAANNNFESRSVAKFAKLLCSLLDRAFLRVKYLVGSEGIRLSQIMKIAREMIATHQGRSIQMRGIIDAGENKVVFSYGPFLVVEVFNPDEFENIYEPTQYAVLYLEDIYDFESKKLQAIAIGNKQGGDYFFSLTFSHVEWGFSCRDLSEVPQKTFSAIESYSDGVS